MEGVVEQGCLRFVIVVFPDHTHLLFLVLAHLICDCWMSNVHHELCVVRRQQLFHMTSPPKLLTEF